MIPTTEAMISANIMIERFVMPKVFAGAIILANVWVTKGCAK
jgi:hypothetical protein